VNRATLWRNVQRRLNGARWGCLTAVFAMLVLIPLLGLYQTYEAAHAYDVLAPGEQRLFDAARFLTAPLVNDPAEDLDAVKGTTWSARVFGLTLSDPLAVVGQAAAGASLYWPFILSCLIPVAGTLLLGRVYCGWICPATFLYELNSNLRLRLANLGLFVGRWHFDRRWKYAVLGLGIVASMVTGTVLFAAFYPPAVIGREIYYAIALGGFGSGALLFVATLLFDLLVARRGFCRYLCPGGALYSLLGRYRVIRIQRNVTTCNDCAKCNAVCEFELNPMGDAFGQECNNCSACIAVCPTDALAFSVSIRDQPPQGPGHLGHGFRSSSTTLLDTRQII
jgi:ferredoxin-type protein NapH